MRFLSLFSGIEAASTAWADLGWECVGFSEIEAFPCQVLEQRHTAVTVRGKPAADGPRYKALGHSMAVPVIRWIGQQIQFAVEFF